MADHGFLRAAGPTVGDLLHGRGADLPLLVHTHPAETVRQAIEILREVAVSQLPAVKHEPPVVLAEVIVPAADRQTGVWGRRESGRLDTGDGGINKKERKR